MHPFFKQPPLNWIPTGVNTKLVEQLEQTQIPTQNLPKQELGELLKKEIQQNNQKSQSPVQVQEQKQAQAQAQEHLEKKEVPVWDCQVELEEKDKTKGRLGRIVKLDLKKQEVWVNYKSNPTSAPVLAKLGRSFEVQELQEAWIKRRFVRLLFLGEDWSQPVLRDVFLLPLWVKQVQIGKNKTHIQRGEIVDHGSTKLFERFLSL